MSAITTSSLSALKECKQLGVLNACGNRVVHIRQAEFLSELPWLGVVELAVPTVESSITGGGCYTVFRS